MPHYASTENTACTFSCPWASLAKTIKTQARSVPRNNPGMTRQRLTWVGSRWNWWVDCPSGWDTGPPGRCGLWDRGWGGVGVGRGRVQHGLHGVGVGVGDGQRGAHGEVLHGTAWELHGHAAGAGNGPGGLRSAAQRHVSGGADGDRVGAGADGDGEAGHGDGGGHCHLQHNDHHHRNHHHQRQLLSCLFINESYTNACTHTLTHRLSKIPFPALVPFNSLPNCHCTSPPPPPSLPFFPQILMESFGKSRF